MVKKILFISLALFGLLFSQMAEECFADAATQFKQAETYKKNKQYEQAEAIYQQIVIDYPGTNDALEAQKQLTLIYIATDRQAEADAAFAELTAGFAGHKEIAEAIWQIGRAYTKAEKYDKAGEVHQYNVENFTDDVYAMWSQIGIVKFYIGDGNDAAAADAAVDKLINVFSEQETLAKEIYKIAERYKNRAKRADKALELHRYNVEHYPADKYGMWSQIDIVKFYIGDGNDAAAADAAVDKLINVFSEQETLAKEIYKIAERYQGLKRLGRAYECYQYVAETCDDERALLSQQQVVYLSLQLEDDAAIDAAVEKLLTGFAGQPGLPEKICEIAKKLKQKRKRDKALELHRYNVEHYPEDKYSMWSQIEIVKFYIGDGNDTAAADAGADKLLGAFSEQKTLAKEIYKIADRYNKAGNREKALQLHKYNIDNFPADANAMWSQVDIIYFHIGGNDAAAADAAVEKLLTVFSEQPSLPEAILQVGEKYNAAGRSDKAMDLWVRNVDNSPNNVNAMLSQLDIIYSYIDPNDGNDAAVDAAVDKFLTVFAEQPTLPEKVHQIGNKYRDSGKYERAIQFYQLAAERWPEGKIAITSWVAIGKVHIELGDDEAVGAIIDGLIADYNDHPDLPKVVFVVGEEYYYKAFDDPNKCLKVKSEKYLYKAKDIWERIVPQRPESQSIDLKHAYYFSAVCYHRLREYERAIEYYQKVVDDWPDYLYAWSAQYLIGNCYEKLRNSGVIPESEANPKIEQAYEAVVEKYPDSGSVNNALLKLGWFNFKKGQWVDAAMYFELFLQESRDGQRSSRVLRVLYDLGRAYEEMGELDVAVQVYSAFIKIAEPTDPRLKRVEARLEELGGNNK